MKVLLSAILLIATLLAKAQTADAQAAIDLCKQKFAYMLNRDSLALRNILHPQLRYIHSSGKVDSRESLVATVTQGSTVYRTLEVFEADARQFGRTVVVTGKLHYGAENKGEPKTYDLLFTEVYCRVKKQWLLVSRHASKM
jgi:hypothetical protein